MIKKIEEILGVDGVMYTGGIKNEYSRKNKIYIHGYRV